MAKRKFTILGGDQRNINLAKLLEEDQNNVQIYGVDKLHLDLYECLNLDEAIKSADIVIGPLPMSQDQNTLNAPFSSKKINLEEIADLLSSGQSFIGGKIDKEFVNKVKKKGIQIEDYFSREEMQVLNAIPSAEGAIQVAMEEMEITLHNSNAMILGFGRIGKTLAKMLQGIGANVYIEARRYKDLAWIENYGYTPVNLKELENLINNMDVIFNTVPHMILNDHILSKMNKDQIIIDLASKPGGVDFEEAEELKIKAIQALGLPGKVAPITAASIIKSTIYNIINEWEE